MNIFQNLSDTYVNAWPSVKPTSSDFEQPVEHHAHDAVRDAKRGAGRSGGGSGGGSDRGKWPAMATLVDPLWSSPGCGIGGHRSANFRKGGLLDATALKPLRWFERLWGVAAWGEPGGESGVALRSVGLPYQRHVQ